MSALLKIVCKLTNLQKPSHSVIAAVDQHFSPSSSPFSERRRHLISSYLVAGPSALNEQQPGTVPVYDDSGSVVVNLSPQQIR